MLPKINPEIIVEAIPTAPGSHEMRIMGKSGDDKLTWDSDDTNQVGKARLAFNDYKNRGYTMYKTSEIGGKKVGDPISEFDPNIERIIAVPPVAGGSSLVEDLIAPEIETRTPIKPSEAIRLGRLTRPQVIAYNLFSGDNAACTFGAMLIGYGFDGHASKFISTLNILFPEMPEYVIKCISHIPNVMDSRAYKSYFDSKKWVTPEQIEASLIRGLEAMGY